MGKKTEPLISIDLGPNGGKIKFYSIEDVENWTNREVQFWQWLQKCTTFDSQTSTIWSQQASPWNKIIETLSRLKSASEADKANLISAVNEVLTNSFVTLRVLHSINPKAKYLLRYSSDPSNQKDIIIAAYALGYFIKAPFKFNLNRPDNLPQILIAIQEAILFDKGVEGLGESERSSLEELRQEYQKLNQSFSDQVRENQEAIEAAKSAFEASRIDEQKKFDELFGQAKSTLEDITKTYDQKLALRSSVSYWSAKANKHRNLSVVFGVAFAGTLTLSGYWFYKFIYPFLDKIPAGEMPPHWTITLMVVFAVVAVWIARIIVRVLLSHIHLQRDASERTTMLLTYLALLREGQGLAENDKKLILEALFRPGVSGIVKDDGIPSSIYDYLTRSGGRS